MVNFIIYTTLALLKHWKLLLLSLNKFVVAVWWNQTEIVRLRYLLWCFELILNYLWWHNRTVIWLNVFVIIFINCGDAFRHFLPFHWCSFLFQIMDCVINFCFIFLLKHLTLLYLCRLLLLLQIYFFKWWENLNVFWLRCWFHFQILWNRIAVLPRKKLSIFALFYLFWIFCKIVSSSAIFATTAAT